MAANSGGLVTARDDRPVHVPVHVAVRWSIGDAASEPIKTSCQRFGGRLYREEGKDHRCARTSGERDPHHT